MLLFLVLKAMQYRQDIATRVPITRVELITILIVTIRSIWHNSATDFLAFWKISAANLRIL